MFEPDLVYNETEVELLVQGHVQVDSSQTPQVIAGSCSVVRFFLLELWSLFFFSFGFGGILKLKSTRRQQEATVLNWHDSGVLLYDCWQPLNMCTKQQTDLLEMFSVYTTTNLQGRWTNALNRNCSSVWLRCVLVIVQPRRKLITLDVYCLCLLCAFAQLCRGYLSSSNIVRWEATSDVEKAQSIFWCLVNLF